VFEVLLMLRLIFLTGRDSLFEFTLWMEFFGGSMVIVRPPSSP
jgi:hypothetical protein